MRFWLSGCVLPCSIERASRVMELLFISVRLGVRRPMSSVARWREFCPVGGGALFHWKHNYIPKISFLWATPKQTQLQSQQTFADNSFYCAELSHGNCHDSKGRMLSEAGPQKDFLTLLTNCVKSVSSVLLIILAEASKQFKKHIHHRRITY